MTEPVRSTVPVGEARLDVAVWGSGTPRIVLLHDGLGSIAQWRDLPALLAQRTGSTVVAYDRPGHGASTPFPSGAWPADWLHRESDRLAGLLAALRIERPILVGHSDGGSIALLHALATGDADRVVTLAAHSWVEDRTTERITALHRDSDRTIRALGRYHAHPEAVFRAWSGVWMSDDFAPWDIRASLAGMTVPTLVVQGADDEYASQDHAAATAAAIGAAARCVLLPGRRHNLHHEAAGEIADLIAEWLAEPVGVPVAPDSAENPEREPGDG